MREKSLDWLSVSGLTNSKERLCNYPLLPLFFPLSCIRHFSCEEKKKKGWRRDRSPSFSFSLFQVCLKFSLLFPFSLFSSFHSSLFLSFLFSYLMSSSCLVSLFVLEFLCVKRWVVPCSLSLSSCWWCLFFPSFSSFFPNNLINHCHERKSALALLLFFPVLFSWLSFSLSSSFWFLSFDFSLFQQTEKREKYMSLFLGISFSISFYTIRK